MSGSSDVFGVCAHLPTIQQIGKAADCGFKWLRVSFNWDEIERTRGGWDIARVKAVVDAATQRGLSLFATLAYCPSWANGRPDRRFPPTSAGDWSSFVGRCVQQFPQIKYWGIWNEPNVPEYGQMTPEQYRNILLLPGSQAVRVAGSQVNVVGPDLSILSGHKWWTWIEGVAAEGGKDAINVFSCHIYRENGASIVFEALERGTRLIEQLSIFAPAFLCKWFPKMQSVYNCLNNNEMGGCPVWVTESGWTTNRSRNGTLSESAQADYIADLINEQQDSSRDERLQRMFLYRLIDDPNEANGDWGVLRSDMSEKPSCGRIRTIFSS